MAFWGVKPCIHRYHDDDEEEEEGSLQFPQATLGSDSSTKKSTLQCQVGIKKPICLCSLIPDKTETCAFNLEFEEEDEVIFSVPGPQSIHLSGFFSGEYEEPIGDSCGSDLYGEDVYASEFDGSSDYDSEEGFGVDSTDAEEDVYPSLPVCTRGVTENGASKEGKKNKQLSASAKSNSEKQLVKRCYGPEVLDPEDEDGLPLEFNDKNKSGSPSTNQKSTVVKDKSNEETKKKQAKDEGSIRTVKRKVEDVVGEKEEKRESGQQPTPSSSDADMKQKKKKNMKKKTKNEEAMQLGDEGHQKQSTDRESGQQPAPSSSNADMKQRKKKNKKKKTNNEEAMQLGDGHQKQYTDRSISIDAKSAVEDKKKNKKNKKPAKEAEATICQVGANNKKSPQEKCKGKSQVRNFPNGLAIEEVAMGKLGGKKASPGKKVGVHYIGKLKKNGEIFDSNIGKALFKFRLGVGQVIKGWDVGVNAGMREGDESIITIPPAVGSYKAKFIVVHALLLFILFSLVPASNGVVVDAPKEDNLVNVPDTQKRAVNYPDEYNIKRDILWLNIFLVCCIIMCFKMLPLFDRYIHPGNNDAATRIQAQQLAKMKKRE